MKFERIIKTLAITALAVVICLTAINIHFAIADHKDYSSTFTHQGHSYVLVHANNATAITHDPDCECYNTNTEKK